MTSLIENNINSFDTIIENINEKYVNLVSEIHEKLKYHDQLAGPLEKDVKFINEKLNENKYQILNILTDNYLFCLEPINDHNKDYFVYQEEKIKQKNGAILRNKISKLGYRTSLKSILKVADKKLIHMIFKTITNIFNLLIIKNNDVISFNDEYINYVKNDFNENKNYNKMLMAIDNVNDILGEEQPEFIPDEIVKKDKSKDDKKKNKSSGLGAGLGKGMMNEDFMKSLETTKIAQLAKNISEKINVDDFPELSDPSKLLGLLSKGGDNSGENGEGIQNLFKFVINEVQDSFKKENIDEKDLIGEAQNIMGQFKDMSGFDPLSMLGGENGIDINKIASMFANLKK
jgi:hypothetical protein